jgi:hypothetical protein
MTLIGPGLAVDEPVDLRKGSSAACVALQHVGVTRPLRQLPGRTAALLAALCRDHPVQLWPTRCSNGGPAGTGRKAPRYAD